MNIEYRIIQNRVCVVAVRGNHPEAEGEILRYAMRYRQDGDLTIQVKHMLPSGPSWKRHMLMAQFPQPTIIGAAE
jgi:hypothetical protein